MSILRLASKGYDTVHYTVKGGKPVEFDLSDQSEKKTLCKLIEKIWMVQIGEFYNKSWQLLQRRRVQKDVERGL